MRSGGSADQFDVLGIYVPMFVFQFVLVFLLLFFVRWLLDRLGILSLFWHRGVAEISLFAILFGLVVLWMSGMPFSAVWAFAQSPFTLR